MHRNTLLLRFFAAAILIGMFIFLGWTSIGGSVRGGIIYILSPLLRLSQEIGISAGFSSYRISEDMAKELAGENQELSSLRVEVEFLRKENEDLRSALGFKKESGLNLFPADVVSFANELGREFLIIAAGGEFGIREGDMAVTADRVLVGMVREADQGFSKIEIASNPLISYEVRLVPLGIPAIAKGMGGRTFSLELIPQDAAVKKGDLVAVSVPGTDEQLLLAEIASEKILSGSIFQEARAVMLLRPEFLESVLIIRSKKP
ncbi:MAG: rod shape-determining protein MreC [Candidatus Sungbacteria bacterium]|nr:rod shape-determining protein MreC [Candidatus Sungbacteria bacterium]